MQRTPGYHGVGLKRKRPVDSTPAPAQLSLHPMTTEEYSEGGGKGHSRREVEGEDKKLSLSHEQSFEEWLKEGFEVVREEDGNRTDTRRRLNVFGVDDRSLGNPEMMDQYPFRCIGQFVRGSSFCTGTIVGKDLILTNRHCLGIVNNQLPSDFYPSSRFLSGFSNGQSNFVGTFTEVYWSDEADDFALLLLSQNIGVFTGKSILLYTSAIV